MRQEGPRGGEDSLDGWRRGRLWIGGRMTAGFSMRWLESWDGERDTGLGGLTRGGRSEGAIVGG
jgi:hypothetical protein